MRGRIRYASCLWYFVFYPAFDWRAYFYGYDYSLSGCASHELSWYGSVSYTHLVVWHLDVGSSHPGAVAGPKGMAVRHLKRYVSWV